MTLIANRRSVIIGLGLSTLPSFAWAEATTHVVEMLNRHPDDKKKRNVFLPLIQVVEPGDTVTFKSVDRGHNSEAIEGMIPDGTEMWKSKVSKDVSVTLQQPGVYGYKCTPHYALGMVGLVIVKGEGMAANLEAAKAVKQRGKARQAFEEIWAQIESENLLS
ncbi:MAG: pseudoazurin [Pseudomonadota bacterium]